MSFIELASLVTIFAFIVGIFSVSNGRMTRRQLSQDLSRIDEHISKMDEHHTRLFEKIIELLAKISK